MLLPVKEEANAAIKAMIKLGLLQEISLQEQGGKALVEESNWEKRYEDKSAERYEDENGNEERCEDENAERYEDENAKVGNEILSPRLLPV